MKKDLQPYTVEDHVNALTNRMDRVERRPLPTGGGGATVYVQPNEPLNVDIGTLWFDTDEVCT